MIETHNNDVSQSLFCKVNETRKAEKIIKTMKFHQRPVIDNKITINAKVLIL